MGGYAVKKISLRLKGEADKEPLHYPDCGLDDVYLLSGYEVIKTPYGEGLSIKNLDGLHNAIGCSLARDKKTLSGKELRFLRKHMDLTQSELGKLLGLSSQQVARWEKGESQIKGPAELLLRVLFLEHTCGKINIQKILSALEERDAPLTESLVFENTGEEWRKKAA